MASIEEKNWGHQQVGKINSAPQDFVVVGGLQVPVVRSSFDRGNSNVSGSSAISSSSSSSKIIQGRIIPQHGIGTSQGNAQLGRVIPTETTNEAYDASPTKVAFRESLSNAEAVMSRQAEEIVYKNNELKRQKERIEQLERFLLDNAVKLAPEIANRFENSVGSSGDKKENSQVWLQGVLGISANAYSPQGQGGQYGKSAIISSTGPGGVGVASAGASSKQRMGLAARRRAESKEQESDPALESQEEPFVHTNTHTHTSGGVSTPGVGVGGGNTNDISPVSLLSVNTGFTNNGFGTESQPLSTGPGHTAYSGGDNLEAGERAAGTGDSSMPDPRFITPTAARGRNSPNPSLRRSNSDGMVTELQQEELALSQGLHSSGSGKNPPKGLAARLAMGSQERRRLGGLKRHGSDRSLTGSDNGRGGNERGSDKKDEQGSSRSTPGSSDRTSKSSHSSSGRARTSSTASGASYGSDESPRDRDREDKDTPAYRLPPSDKLFEWRVPTGIAQQKSSGSSSDMPHMFIAHDNPQLGSTVGLHLRTDPSGGMQFMLETKYEDTGKSAKSGKLSNGASASGFVTCFIVGKIAYSGPFEGIAGATLDSVGAHSNSNPDNVGKVQRGSLALVCTEMTGYTSDIKGFPTRNNGEIVEIDLITGHTEHALDEGMSASLCSPVKLDTREKLTEFLRKCTSRVDVILDPSNSENKWYPYFEGRRRMAPQFRSRGVGYLRLGDDMSNYGSAFLSLDAGRTFLDDGATSILSDNNNSNMGFSKTIGGGSGGKPIQGGLLNHGSDGNTSGFASTYPTYGSSGTAGSDSHNSNSPTTDTDALMGGVGLSTPGTGVNMNNQHRSTKELELRKGELREIVALLRDPDLKWADRTQHLQRLRDLGDTYAGEYGNGTGDNNSYQGGSSASAGAEKGTTEIISVLTDTILRQNNPHVLRAAVSCLRTVSLSAAAHASCGVAWRALLLEAFHLLRVANRPVFEEAKDTLDCLHVRTASAQPYMGTSTSSSRRLTLSQLLPQLDDIFAGT